MRNIRDLLLGEEELIEFYNKHTFEELVPIIKSALEMGELEEKENGIVAIWTAGWGNDEFMIGCLRDYRCVHRYNYIGHVFAESYFIKDKDKNLNCKFEIVAVPKKNKKEGE